MRIFVPVSLFLALVALGCGGDSSALMTIGGDADGGVPPAATGGQGGTVTGSGGSGSGGVPSSTTVVVVGGIRDVATTFCTTTTGDSCAVSAELIACGKNHCGESLTNCYRTDGAGGMCKSYASCRLACSCDAKDRGKCENKCMADYGMTDTVCSDCLASLYLCSKQYGCLPPTTCPSSSTGS